MSLERRIIVSFVAGDSAPELQIRFRGLSLADYSAISMHVQREDGSRFSRTVVPDGTDPELGTVTWIDGDLVTGTHKAEFEFTRIADSKVFTVPSRYTVTLSVRRGLG